MERTSLTYKTYLEILNRELVCAMGCTEPIAIAYCAAAARRALGALPTCIEVAASGNIIKNVKSVIVPNTGGLRGIAAAAAIGALAGDADAGLQVVSHVTPEQIAALPGYMAQTKFEISAAESEYLLDIEVTVRANDHFATVRAVQEHTNIILVETDEGVLFAKDPEQAPSAAEPTPDYTLLNVADICEFADTCELEDVKPLLDRQLRYLSPTVLFVTILSIINSFKVFREIYLLSGDYPYEGLYMLQHFMNNMYNKNLDYQRLSAAAIMLAVVIIALIALLFAIENYFGKDVEG